MTSLGLPHPPRLTSPLLACSSAMLPAWMPGPVVSGGFLEGSAVRLPEGGAGLLLRCRVYDGQGRMYDLQHACFFKLRPRPAGGTAQQAAAGPWLASGGHLGSGQGDVRFLKQQRQQQQRQQQQTKQQQQAGHQPRPREGLLGEPAGPGALGSLAWQGFVSMPGGGNKFIVRYDGSTGRYLALTNPSVDRYGSNPDARNILVLVSRQPPAAACLPACLLRCSVW